MTNTEFERQAKKAGFDDIYFVPPEKYDGDETGRLVLDPQKILAGANTIILLIKKCPLSEETDTTDATISNYYLASNAAYREAGRLANELNQRGYPSVSNVQIPIKQCMLRNGIGIRGENSLVYIDSIGSAMHVQTLLTKAEFQYSRPQIQIMNACKGCGKCVRACPSGAIGIGGIVDRNRCLRAVCETVPIPEQYEELMGNHLLGCEICQIVCPMNIHTERQKPYSISLKDLLHGNIEKLKSDIGINYARKQKLQLKACILCANMKRSDLTEDLRELIQEENKEIAAAAQKALNRIK